MRNLQDVHVLAADQLNTYDVLCSDDVIFTRAALDAFDAASSRTASKPVTAGGTGSPLPTVSETPGTEHSEHAEDAENTEPTVPTEPTEPGHADSSGSHDADSEDEK